MEIQVEWMRGVLTLTLVSKFILKKKMKPLSIRTLEYFWKQFLLFNYKTASLTFRCWIISCKYYITSSANILLSNIDPGFIERYRKTRVINLSVDLSIKININLFSRMCRHVSHLWGKILPRLLSPIILKFNWCNRYWYHRNTRPNLQICFQNRYSK